MLLHVVNVDKTCVIVYLNVKNRKLFTKLTKIPDSIVILLPNQSKELMVTHLTSPSHWLATREVLQLTCSPS